jgi:hypothetical protein
MKMFSGLMPSSSALRRAGSSSSPWPRSAVKVTTVRDYVFPMFRANAQYEGIYLLGTSIARPLIAKKQISGLMPSSSALRRAGSSSSPWPRSAVKVTTSQP